MLPCHSKKKMGGKVQLWLALGQFQPKIYILQTQKTLLLISCRHKVAQWRRSNSNTMLPFTNPPFCLLRQLKFWLFRVYCLFCQFIPNLFNCYLTKWRNGLYCCTNFPPNNMTSAWKQQFDITYLSNIWMVCTAMIHQMFHLSKLILTYSTALLRWLHLELRQLVH